jgi:two-component system, NtrC family, sensor kinase
MSSDGDQRVWFWTTLLLSCLTISSVVFAAWELVEQRFFRYLNFRQLHYLYITRGVASSLLLAIWAVWFVLRERLKTEAELRRSRERYWAMLAHAADAVILLDHNLTVLEWNPQATTLYGYSREEVVGRSLQTLGLAEQEELLQIVQRLEQGESVVELEAKRRNRMGDWVDVGLRVSSFRDVGSGERVVLEMASDLREKIRLRQKALEMEKLTSMGRMAAGTAHTLNTPLSAMLLRIGMLQDRLARDGCAEEMHHLESSTRFCQEFVQKLLQYSRPTETELKHLDVAELLASIETFFKPTFQVRRHTLRSVGGDLHNACILADRSQMEALFAALLMNSLDALPASGGGCVELEGFVKDGHVNLVVSDNGSGVPPGQFSHIFEPFFTTKKAGQGTGLGLSIARNIVQDHSGTIELANNPSGGVIVRISFPLALDKVAFSAPAPLLGVGGQRQT